MLNPVTQNDHSKSPVMPHFSKMNLPHTRYLQCNKKIQQKLRSNSKVRSKERPIVKQVPLAGGASGFLGTGFSSGMGFFRTSGTIKGRVGAVITLYGINCDIYTRLELTACFHSQKQFPLTELEAADSQSTPQPPRRFPKLTERILTVCWDSAHI